MLARKEEYVINRGLICGLILGVDFGDRMRILGVSIRVTGGNG
jgi:hypothetical protein